MLHATNSLLPSEGGGGGGGHTLNRRRCDMRPVCRLEASAPLRIKEMEWTIEWGQGPKNWEDREGNRG
eukprot:scaffold16840_cov152-Isochrysis_galbana.AAC.3